MVRMTPNKRELERLRKRTAALLISDRERQGPILVALDRVHSQQARRAFTTEGVSTGSAWKPLSKGYAAWKRRVKPGRRILVFSGDMRDRFTLPASANHIREWVRPWTYLFGVASTKAWRHETGTGEGKQVLPRRSVLAKTAADLKQFTEAFASYYIKRTRQVLRHL
jgi:hypothetical protein